MKKYLRTVRNRLKMPADLRAKVMKDLESSIASRHEEGQSDAQIMQELGSPKEVADELNRQLTEYTYHKSPWRWVCLGVSILVSVIVLSGGWLQLITWMFNKSINHSIGIIGGADGPTAIFVTTSPDGFLIEVIICLLFLVAGLFGFFKLGHLRRKQKNNPPVNKTGGKQ